MVAKYLLYLLLLRLEGGSYLAHTQHVRVDQGIRTLSSVNISMSRSKMEQSPNIGQMIILTSFHAVYVSAHAPQGYVLTLSCTPILTLVP